MSQDTGASRKLTKHSIEHLTSPNSDADNGSDGGPPSSPEKQKHLEKETHQEKIVSYTEMIAKAIFATPNNMSTLADIYNYLIVKYPILKSRGKSWKNSVRHTLSLNEWFIKIPKLDNAKCCYWSVHPVYVQRFKRGDFQKQRKTSTKLRTPHPNRYFDFGYDISPTLDYHFLPPSYHFQEMNSGLPSHNSFSPWPVSRSVDEFSPNFVPPIPPYPPYSMYNNAPPTTSYQPYYANEHDEYYRQEASQSSVFEHPPPSMIKNAQAEELSAMYNKQCNGITSVVANRHVKLEPRDPSYHEGVGNGGMVH